MSNKNLIWLPIVLGIILVIGIAAFFVVPKNTTNRVNPNGSLISANTDKDILPVNKNSQTAVDKQSIPNNASSQSPVMTVADVETHNNESSCYVIYQKNVYDLTSFIGRHSGGSQSIIDKCGKNIDDFSAFHPGGNFSNPKVQRAIKSLVVGTVQ